MRKIRLFLLAVLLGAAGYFLLSYHIIYFGNSIKILNKSRPTSDYTFIWAANKSVESILRIDTLREAGIGDIFVKMGKLNEEDKNALEKKFDSDPVFYWIKNFYSLSYKFLNLSFKPAINQFFKSFGKIEKIILKKWINTIN